MAGASCLPISFTVNGQRRDMTVAVHLMLASLLRDGLGLKSCKIACDASVCGSCTVLVDGRPAAACSTFAFEIDGAQLTTAEGLGDPDRLHPIQNAFLERDAFQCGFCTPGMTLATLALLSEHPDPDEATIREWLGGNLCRCTGYQMIVEAVLGAAKAVKAARAGGGMA